MPGTSSPVGHADHRIERRRAVVAALAAVATLAMTTIALLGLSGTNADARPIVLAATAVGTLAGLAGAWFAWTGRIRVAGALLVLAVVTPTFAAAVVNLVPLALGIVLLVDSFRSDGSIAGRRPAGARRSPRRVPA